MGTRPVSEIATIRWSLRSDLHRRATAYEAVTLLLSYRGEREAQLVPTTIHGPASRYPLRAGDGNRTRDSGVAHRRVTSTLRLLGGVLASKTPVVADRRGRVKLRPATQTSHPLESNQNLPGFNRARRPTTQEWDVSMVCAAFEATHTMPRSSSSVLQLSENAALPLPRSGVRSGVLRSELEHEKGRRGFPRRPARSHVVTWLPCRTPEAIRTHGGGTDQGPRRPEAFGPLIGRAMKIEFRHGGHSMNESSMVHTDNSR